MTTNKEAPALTEAQPTKHFHFSRILDAVTVIYCIGMGIVFFVGVLK